MTDTVRFLFSSGTDRSVIGYFFEAAHEAIHCLSPNVPSGRATYLEEAIAAVV